MNVADQRHRRPPCGARVPRRTATPARRQEPTSSQRAAGSSRGSSHDHARWLRDVLRSDILAGRTGDGGIPPEPELMGTHHVSRSVVREALALLRNEGVIERIPGTGTFAVAERFAYRITELHGAEGLSDRGITNQVVACERIPMPRLVAARLRADTGDDCLLLEYIGRLHGSAIGIYTNYIRFPEAEAVARTPFRSDWWTLLADAGLRVGGTDLRIESLPADDVLADTLGIAAGQPVLGVEQLILDPAGVPFDYALLRNRGDRIAVSSRASRDPRGDRSR